MMTWILFFLCCAALLLLPMLPALFEWRQKRDALPLKVVREYDGNIKHFATSYRAFLATRMPGLLPGAAPSGPVPGAHDNAEVHIAGPDGAPRFSPAEQAARSSARMLVCADTLALGEDMLFETEVYAGTGVSSGARNTFRAILSCGPIRLGDDCAVLRWAHSDASLALGLRARLYGRVSADHEISLQQSSRFGRMWAPVIRFGAAPARPTSTPLPVPAPFPLAEPDDLLDRTDFRWLVDGDLDVPAGAFHHGSLVARENVQVGAHARLQGDIKSNGALVIGDHVTVDGALVATGSIHIGRDCTIKGPVVCDALVVIESGTVVGRADCPTSVSAAEIRIDEGVVAHGTVWARELGFVAVPRGAGA